MCEDCKHKITESDFPLNEKGDPVTDTVLEVQNGEHIVNVEFGFNPFPKKEEDHGKLR